MTDILQDMSKSDLPALERLFQLYLYDLSAFANWTLSSQGVFAYPPDLLTSYFHQWGHHPYFILQDGVTVGFCLVRRAPENSQVWDIGQFFVLRKFRRSNVGISAFRQALLCHSGAWQVRVLPENQPAYQFWKTSIAATSDGAFTETVKPYGELEMTYFAFDA